MKALLGVLFIVLFNLQFCYSQNFEGIIKWKISSNEQKKVGNSENLENLKKLEEQMKDPEFIRQMEKNPQLKEMMEKNITQLKNGQANDNSKKGFLPEHITIKIKDQNTLVKMEGGIADFIGDFLYRKDKDATYNLKRKNKTYSVIPKTAEDKKTTFKVTKTEVFSKVMGYNCRKYIVENEMDGKKLIQTVWATNEIKTFDKELLKKMDFGKSFSGVYYEGIDGIPLKIENESQEMQIVMEVVEIKSQTLDASDFNIPDGYKQTKF
ncbi:MAG: DUF4412 domain-containing protein [Cytophagaceae bacterium]